MAYLFGLGFLGTQAPYYIDTIVVYLLFLPILMAFSISLAIRKMYGLHRFIQTILLVLTLSSLLIFNYEINGINSIVDKGLYLLVMIEIFFSFVLSVMWVSLLLFAIEYRRRRGLPSLYSASHKKSGRRVFIVILLTVLINLYLYRSIYYVQ